jgi:hypothetical protein
LRHDDDRLFTVLVVVAGLGTGGAAFRRVFEAARYAIKVKLPETRHLAADALRAGRSGAGEERMGRLAARLVSTSGRRTDS